jgi:hypothetical protein
MCSEDTGSIPRPLALLLIRHIRRHPHVESALILGLNQDEHSLVFWTFDQELPVTIRTVDEALSDPTYIESCPRYVC